MDGAQPKQPTVTDAVFDQLRTIVAADSTQGNWLRVAVLGGGCAGFQYQFALETTPADDDLQFSNGDVGVIIDPVSLPFLADAVIDYKKELIGARFAIDNPNATSSCGCGVSFSI
jgi:iron-sulfur cluster assembly accessory protein